jgi:hypothetical protein
MSWVLRYIRRHLIALLALFVALGGTSVAAANLINGKQIKPHTIPQNRLTNSTINALRGSKGAKGAPGARGVTGARGATGAAGGKGVKGDTGAPGSAVAYGYVNLDGTLDTANSKNVLTSRYDYGGPGYLYCVQVNVPFKNAVVTADGFDSTLHLEVAKGDPFTSCGGHGIGQVRGDISVEFNGGTKQGRFWVTFN